MESNYGQDLSNEIIPASGIFEIQNEIVKSILTAIGGYYGAITRDMMKLPDGNHTNGTRKLRCGILVLSLSKSLVF